LKDRDFTAKLPQFTGVLAGICGGFQMLGLSIEYPAGVENGGQCRCVPGLGQLPIRTVLRDEKTVRRATGRTRLFEFKSFSGYEIHMGETLYENGAEPFAEIVRENETTPIADGAIARSGRVFGTYVHGLFDDDAFRHGFLDSVRETCGLTPARDYSTADREARIDRWADHLRESLDMNLIRGWI
jgi:adenosylcobyric acid synthase